MRGDRAIPLDDGPYTHLLDSGPGEPGSYSYAENVYPFSAVTGDRLIGRPGRWRTNLPFAIAPDPGTGIRNIQGIATFRLPFIRWTVAIVDGAFFTYNWLADSWQGGPLAGVLTAAGITINPDANPVYLVQLRAGLLISDGVNTPWIWNGLGFLAANVTKLTNAPVFLGRPVLRGGRIYGLKESDPTTMVWSETDDPNVGYEAGGYNNAWRLTQSNPNPLTALDADNEGLTILRRRSATRVYGEDPQEFVSGNAEDTLDEHIGVVTSAAVVPFGRGLVVLDSDLKLHWLRPGSDRATPLWHGFAAFLAGGAKRGEGRVALMAAAVFGVHYTPADLLLFASRVAFSNDPQDLDQFGNPESFIFVLDATEGETPTPVAIWRGLGNIQAMAMVPNDANEASSEYLMFGADGQIFVLGNPDQDHWGDAYTSDVGARSIRHRFRTRQLGYSTAGEKTFDRVDVVGASETDQTLSVSVITSDLSAPAQEVVVPAGEDVKVELGVDARGRWAIVDIDHGGAVEDPIEQFGLSAIAVTAVSAGRDPRAR